MFTLTEQHLEILRRADITPTRSGSQVEHATEELLIPGWEDLSESERFRLTLTKAGARDLNGLKADTRTALEIVLTTGQAKPGRYRLNDPYGARTWTRIDNDEDAAAAAAQTVHDRQDELRDNQLATAAGQVTAVREVIAYARTREGELLATRDAEPSHRREARDRWEDRAHEIRCFADRLQAALDNAQLVEPADLPHAPMVAPLRSGEWGVHCLACSDRARDYVPRCLVKPDGWPPLVLRDAPPSTLLEARARAATDTYGAVGELSA
ncbi:hypothetical protein [Actinomadura sp. WMMA1423]|uniref:hypothetical protein n=1 Tax=Actinomadura sp. WMMA1423 TaxID=2591108 RepID=UPI0011474989|nr:hypothetical protein [Actinomadura sp. WMMA1423]